MNTVIEFDYCTLPTILEVLKEKYIGKNIKVHRFIADQKDEDMYAIPPELIIQNNCEVESKVCKILNIIQDTENEWAVFMFVVDYNGKEIEVLYPIDAWVDYEDED